MLGQPVRVLKLGAERRRLYSVITRLRVATESDGWRDLLVKQVSAGPRFDRHIESLKRAQAAFANRADVRIPYLGHDSSLGIIVMDWIQDPSLSQLLEWPKGLVGKLRIRHWIRRAQHACHDVGRWLDEWHDLEPGRECLAFPLLGYLENRSEELELLDTDLRQRLLRLVQALPEDYSCAAHGDFTPPNVLWSPKRITVLDFGIAEWMHATPAWDYATMAVGLEQKLRFSGRCPARWLSFLRPAMLGSFQLGYEASGRLNHSQGEKACRAIRHLVSYAQGINATGDAYRRARWHYARLQQLVGDEQRSKRASIN